jgi:hypothetical protein
LVRPNIAHWSVISLSEKFAVVLRDYKRRSLRPYGSELVDAQASRMPFQLFFADGRFRNKRLGAVLLSNFDTRISRLPA